MNDKKIAQVLDGVARENLPEELDLLPGVMARVQRSQPTQRKPTMNTKLKWAAIVAAITVALTAFLLSIPGVVEAFQRLLGYIPGSGLVETSAPLRVLEAPLSQTREGVTITVEEALLTSERTQVKFSVFGVPAEAYPQREDVLGCLTRPYIVLPDGAQLTEADPIPAQVDHATFVIPCIANTLPGKAPEDWRFELRFVPAPPDLTVMPVVDVVETATAQPTATASATQAQPTPAQPAEVLAGVEKYIETENGYILIGTFRPQVAEGSWVEVTNMPQISDAAGKRVLYDLVTDIELPVIEEGSMGRGEFSWAYQIKDAGVTYPLTLSFPGVYISAAQPPETAEFEFDAGANPQAGQEWRLERDIQLSGHTLRLISISCTGSRISATGGCDGYTFVFSNANGIQSVNVEIVGAKAVGGGGGYGGDSFTNDMIFQQLPTGKLTVRLSGLKVSSDPYIWTAQWSPQAPHPSRSSAVTPAAAAQVCADANSLPTLAGLPEGLSGSVLAYDPDKNVVTLQDMATLQSLLTLPSQANRAALSPDGKRIAYSGEGGIQIVDVGMQPTTSLQGPGGYNTAWSPDGSQLAYVDGANGIYTADVTGGAAPRQLSSAAHEAVVGWSPESGSLYVLQPDLSGGTWMLRRIDAASGAAENLFVLADASRKAPAAALSTDGRRVAYRDGELNSVLLADLQDGGAAPHLLLDISGSPDFEAISGLFWSGQWLGVGLVGGGGSYSLVLIDPASCAAYRIDGVGGYLLGMAVSH